jgi:hypothetical protein
MGFAGSGQPTRSTGSGTGQRPKLSGTRSHERRTSMHSAGQIDSGTLSALLGVSGRQARNLCRDSAINGHPIVVHNRTGRGGAAGTIYSVQVSSLPVALQERLNALQTSGEVDLKPIGTSAGQRERSWKLDLLRPILITEKRSPERAAAVDAIAGKERLDWRGKPVMPSRTAIYRWLAAFEGKKTIQALERSTRSDKGNRRCHVSSAWDAAVPFDNAVKAEIAADLLEEIRGLIKGGARFKQVSILGGNFLRKLTLGHGYQPTSSAALDRICRVPRRMIDAQADARKVYRHKFDRKASEDDRPRALRTIKGLAPMQIVVLDVHHLNVLLRREDGTTATPKVLAFLDVATNRVWCDLIFFEKAGGVRNLDVISSFVAMGQHPAFGLADFLYCDNGSEYGFVDDLDDALKLKVRLLPKDMLERESNVVRARAYNAAAKRVEAFFRDLNQGYARHLKGWIDDDRMNPKRREMGKKLPVFEGGFDVFSDHFFGLLKAYEAMPQEGALAARSPAQAFGDFVKTGWRATVIDPSDLLSVFTRPENRKVRKHGINVDGGIWVCDGLDAFLGDDVTVRIPRYHGFNDLRIEDRAGNLIGIANRQVATDYLDTRAAKHTADRVRRRNAAIRKTDRDIPEIDVTQRLIDFGAAQPAVVPNAPIGTVAVRRSDDDGRFIAPRVSNEHSFDERDREIEEMISRRKLALEGKIK